MIDVCHGLWPRQRHVLNMAYGICATSRYCYNRLYDMNVHHFKCMARSGWLVSCTVVTGYRAH